ncbi:TPA: type II secretion system F family protein [Escherichia coli]|nr:hypothetical protein [Escherichia coli]HAM7339897.1 hypothetical protein [Escherichia coli]HAN1831329.1 hypothetical protein [Escherichia coli]
MFWRDITLSVWRKKTTGLKTKKRLLPLVLAAALCSSPVWAEEATFTANFKDTDLKSFIETVGANLNKTIIMGPGVQGKVSIRTMTPLNERQYYQLFLNLLEAQGYAVVPMENDVLKVVKSSAAKVEPLPLVGEGSDNYAGDEMVTKVVPVLEGIQTAAAVSANRYVEQQLLLAADRVREGSSLRAALAELRLFPPMMLYMIASGEQSGELETMLEQAAVNQEREFDTQVGLALGLFEPALVVMMAGVVLFIVIAILEPMLQLNNMVGM